MKYEKMEVKRRSFLRISSFIVASLVALCVTTSSWAVWSSQGVPQTIWGGIEFTDPGTIDMSVVFISSKTLLDAAGNPAEPTVATTLNWEGVSAGQQRWWLADTQIILHSTITSATGGIQIYSDNTDPLIAGTGFDSMITTVSPAGLVGFDPPAAGGPLVKKAPLPMCWRITDEPINHSSYTIRQGAIGYPSRLWAEATGDQYPAFHWLVDKSTFTLPGSTIINGSNAAKLIDGDDGIQHAEATWGWTKGSPDYIYIGANFAQAKTPRVYKVKLTIESFTE